jgi:hypothetical protein
MSNGLLDGTSGNFGEDLDFGLSLANTGASASTLAALRTGIDAGVASYAATNAAAAAKAAWFYEAAGADPKHAGVGSTDLITPVEAAVDDSTGEFGTDGGNQGLAVLALEGASSSETANATQFLLSEQCGDGGWAWGTGCAYGTDLFDTVPAVLALAPQRGTSPAVDSALDAGIAYLKSQQAADGAFSQVVYDDDYNPIGTEKDTNDTGLAGWALGAAGATDAAQKAASWVAAHQIAPDCGTRQADAGAIMWTDAQFATGVNDTTRDTAIYAGAQALAGLAYLPASTPSVTAPTGFIKAGSPTSVTVTGLRAGETACLSGGSAPVKVTGPGAVTVTAPAGTATRTLTLTSLGATPTVMVKALGAAKLKVKAKPKVERGKKLKVKVTGLAAGEKVKVKLGKKRLGTDIANAAGKAKVKAKLTKKAKIGKVKVKAIGQFADRVGKKKIKVTR